MPAWRLWPFRVIFQPLRAPLKLSLRHSSTSAASHSGDKLLQVSTALLAAPRDKWPLNLPHSLKADTLKDVAGTLREQYSVRPDLLKMWNASQIDRPLRAAHSIVAGHGRI